MLSPLRSLGANLWFLCRKRQASLPLQRVPPRLAKSRPVTKRKLEQIRVLWLRCSRVRRKPRTNGAAESSSISSNPSQEVVPRHKGATALLFQDNDPAMYRTYYPYIRQSLAGIMITTGRFRLLRD